MCVGGVWISHNLSQADGYISVKMGTIYVNNTHSVGQGGILAQPREYWPLQGWSSRP